METLKAIFTRQSVRSYAAEQISREDLEIILKAACAAPVANGKFEEVHLTVLQDQKLMDRITACAAKTTGNPDLKPFYGAPTVILVSSFPGKNLVYANAACMIENMAIAAADRGLGSVYLWGFIDSLCKDTELLKELQLPEGFAPISAIAVGHPTTALTEREVSLEKVGITYLR